MQVIYWIYLYKSQTSVYKSEKSLNTPEVIRLACCRPADSPESFTQNDQKERSCC